MGFEILTFFNLTRNKKRPCSTFKIKSTILLFDHGSRERKLEIPVLCPLLALDVTMVMQDNGIGCLNTLDTSVILPTELRRSHAQAEYAGVHNTNSHISCQH